MRMEQEMLLMYRRIRVAESDQRHSLTSRPENHDR
jgi:hypothetical protein